MNAGNGEGLEAWRLMCQRFEPVAHSRQAGMLLEILAWDFTGDVLLRMEAMERRIADYEKAGEKLSDAISVEIVMRQLPEGPVKQHLIMNAERLAQWHVFRNEVCNIRRAQLAVQNAATPMEIGALNKGGGQRRQGQGQGQAGRRSERQPQGRDVPQLPEERPLRQGLLGEAGRRRRRQDRQGQG